MKRWAPGLALVVLLCVAILAGHSRSPALLLDSDTDVLLQAIQQRQNPWSWFGGDWPLGNHFYRPISTLVFEFDYAVHGSNAAGYGFTNAVLVVFMTLALFWFLRELTDRPFLATSGALLFGLWTLNLGHWIAVGGWFLAWTAGLCLLLPKRGIIGPFVAVCLAHYAVLEMAGLALLRARIIDWLPGRTATTMAVFCLVALAAYCRYERLSAALLPGPDPSPLDPPATKNTAVRGKPPRHAWVWAAVAMTSVALALGSYEQAVMLPSVMVLTALAMRAQRYRVRWGWVAASFALLAGYLVLRSQVIPTSVSGYQAQQFRNGPGVWIDLLGYASPAFVWAYLSLPGFQWPLLVLASTWDGILRCVGNVVAWTRMKVRPPFAAYGLASSFLAFLPMAWLKSFDHYDAWPMAMRAILAAAVLGMAWEALASAASRPTLQAPGRRDPAPGSLPHR